MLSFSSAQCGSCWAFSSVSTLESAYTIKYGVHNIYSEQQVVSCDSSCTIVGGYNECNQGCNGGWEDTVYAWVNSNGGLASSAAYPYTSATGVTGTCITTGYTNDATLKPTGKVQVTTGSTAALQAAVATTPTQVAIDGSSSVFQLYVSGVITSGCGTKSDHAVVVVGYDLTAPTPYFKVRNSWGTSWGQNGYVYISSNQASNTCIILSDPAYPLLS